MVVDELRAAGLLEEAPELTLTDKGWDWLRALESLKRHEEAFAQAEDLVLSTNGIFR